MLQRAVQNGLIQSFKPISTNEIYGKFGKGNCEIFDERFDPKHEFSHNGYSLLILHQEREDELMALVFHKERKENVHEESIKVEDKGEEVREPDKCEVQLTDQEEKWKNQEADLKVKEKIKGRWSSMGKTTLLQNRKRQKVRKMELKKNGKTEKEETRERRHKNGKAKKESLQKRKAQILKILSRGERLLKCMERTT